MKAAVTRGSIAAAPRGAIPNPRQARPLHKTKHWRLSYDSWPRAHILVTETHPTKGCTSPERSIRRALSLTPEAERATEIMYAQVRSNLQPTCFGEGPALFAQIDESVG